MNIRNRAVIQGFFVNGGNIRYFWNYGRIFLIIEDTTELSKILYEYFGSRIFVNGFFMGRERTREKNRKSGKIW